MGKHIQPCALTDEGLVNLLEAMFKYLRADYKAGYKPKETLDNYRYWYKLVTGDNITEEAVTEILMEGRSVTSRKKNAKKKSR